MPLWDNRDASLTDNLGTHVKPEERARQTIDAMLAASGWLVQDMSAMNVHASRGVAVRELPLGRFGYPDYALYLDGKPAGVVEAKKEGSVLTSFEVQPEKYAHGMSEAGLSKMPVPFRYLSAAGGVQPRRARLTSASPKGCRRPDRREPERADAMDELMVFYDADGHTLTVWFGKPEDECACNETG